MTLYTFTLNRDNRKRFRVVECYGSKIIGTMRTITPYRKKGKHSIHNENALRKAGCPSFIDVTSAMYHGII
jgi:hypothetical protein